MSLNMNLRKLSEHQPKVCQHCYDKTAKGRYVKMTRMIQRWFCDRCAPKFEVQK